MRLMAYGALRERYRKAELRLRELLFGDASYSGGRLKGEEHREQATRELRVMHVAFDEAVEKAESSERTLDEELTDALTSAREKQGDPGKGARG
jgi:hypothetical protein